MSDTPKILLLGDYSNCHRTLATGLRRLGCEVTQMSSGSSWMDCERQIDMSRKAGKLGGLELYWRMMYGDLRRHLKGFDIVALHDPHFASLRPERLRTLFQRLKRDNGGIFLTAMSTDIAYLDMVSAPDCPLKYSEWYVGSEPSRMHAANPQKWAEWHSPELMSYQEEVFAELSGAVSVLYEYQLGMERKLGSEKAAYGGLPIDISRFEPLDLSNDIECVKLFLGRDRTRKLMKGSDLLEEAAKIVIERHPGRAELVIVENRPYAEFVELLKGAHVVLDQIYSYTPATTALMAMAYGLNVVSGGEPEYYDFIHEYDNRPIINAPIELEALIDTIEQIVLHPEEIAERGKNSRKFVEKHNECEIVAKRFLEFWTSRL
ncbi:MAG: glycosyltransferase family 4 protein [Bacteroidales bacterium]|nr:glycosyltransferase family 4 protein [Bacteroidales bacterium]